MELEKIETEENYQKALQRFEVIFDAKPDTFEAIELDRLADLIVAYENQFNL